MAGEEMTSGEPYPLPEARAVHPWEARERLIAELEAKIAMLTARLSDLEGMLARRDGVLQI